MKTTQGEKRNKEDLDRSFLELGVMQGIKKSLGYVI